MQILKRIVRGYFVANHYPHSMVRMFNWTPDECAPEFYTDVSVFASIHKAHGLEDIELPSFAPTPHEFIAYHRAILESDEVSSQLHHWINLTFGHQLIGEEAMNNLNVPLVHALSKQQEDGGTPDLDGHPGFRVLFDRPHPKKDIGVVGATSTGSTSGVNGANAGSGVNGANAGSGDSSRRGGNDHTTHTHHAESRETGRFSENRHIQSMLDMGETYGIMSTPYPDPPPEEETVSKRRGAKYLSQGNTGDKTLRLLKFAQTGRLDNHASDNRWYRAEAMKFAACYGTLLEPSYKMPLFLSSHNKRQSQSSDTKPSTPTDNKLSWDREFEAQVEEYYAQPLSTEDATFVSELDRLCMSADELNSCYPASASTSTRGVVKDSADGSVVLAAEAVIHLLQAQDMFAVGCLIAEMFTEKPLFSEEDTCSASSYADIQAVLHKNIMQCTSPIPLNIRRIISLLTHPHPVYRPSAADILQQCCVDDREIEENIAEVQNGVLFFETGEQPRVLCQPLSSVPRRHLLEDFCHFSFPSHFQSVYIFIGRLKLARDGLCKLRAVSDNLLELSVFSLEALSVVLPHVLEVIGDPLPFQQLVKAATTREGGRSSSTDNTDEINNTSSTAKSDSKSNCRKKKSTVSRSRSNSQSNNRSRCNSNETHAVDEVQELITQFAKILNVLGDRLGSVNTARILMPHVINLLHTLNSSTLLVHFIQSKHLWLVILSYAGTKCFLRQFLPLLLTYLVSGTLHTTPRATRLMCRSAFAATSPSSSSPLGAMPLWVSGDSFKEEQPDDWLHTSNRTDLFAIQEETVKVIQLLSVPEALGCGLCSRYLLPSLLCLVANPRFSITGFGISLEDADYNMVYKAVLDPETNVSNNILVDKKAYLNLFSNKITLLSEYDEEYMFAVRAVLGICQSAGELVITTTVLPKIFFELLPRVFVNILNLYMPDASTVNTSSVESFASGPFLSSLLEIISLLRGLLTTLSAKSIRSFYFNTSELPQPSGVRGGRAAEAVSLLTLLIILPLPFINPDNESIDYSDGDEENNKVSTKDEDYAKVMRLLEFRQRHSMFIELCRLITAAASQVGSDIIHNQILPAINKFFTKFVHTYCDLDVRSDLMSLAFEIGRSLYIPMVQLVGADSFSTAVPDVNPRLEVWLLHSSSSSSDDVGVRNSELNVLPDTIFPVTMSKQDITPEREPEKEKGLWGTLMPDWLAPSPPRKTKPENRKASITVDKEAEARLNQQMDDAMRDAIAQQEVHRELVQTPVKQKPAERHHKQWDSDDDSVTSPCPSTTDGMLSISTDYKDATDDNGQTAINLDTKGSNVSRNHQTKSVMHYHGDNSFYHALHSLITDSVTLSPVDKVYFKQQQQQSKPKVNLSLVNSVGKLTSKIQATSFHPTHTTPTARTNSKTLDDNVMSNFRKALKSTIQRSPSTNKSDPLSPSPYDEEEDGAGAAEAHSDQAWLLGGTGRWTSDSVTDRADSPLPPPKAKTGPHSPVSSHPASASTPKVMSSPLTMKPAANVSMAAPKVITDAASEAGEPFTLNMMNASSWAFDALAYKANAAGAVNIMLTDPTERFLVAGTKDGEMKVWSLMSNPVVELMKYSAHQAGVFSAGFLKSGTHVASCDGTIRIWDIETGMTIADMQRSHSELDIFNHLQVVSPRVGVGQGDDQLMTCAGAVLAHYDVRVGYMSSLNPISEWKLYTNLTISK